MKLIEPYNPQWAIAFNELKSFLNSQLSPILPDVDIQHVGSTAIPGLMAKAILDIDIIIEEKAMLAAIDDKLRECGYIAKGEQGIPGRYAYRQSSKLSPLSSKPPTWQTHHLYVCLKNSLALKNHLLFRDMLLQNQQLREAYADLKLKLTHNRFILNNDYATGKTDFILNVLSTSGLSTAEIEQIRSCNS